MPFVLHRSNRIEALFEQLALNLEGQTQDPFLRPWLVTQNPGMTKWLNLRLSERFGVWTNDQVFFPKRLVERVLALTLGPEVAGLRAWSVGAMTLGLAQLLKDLDPDPALEPLEGYLSRRSGSFARLELAQKVAQCFDQYLVYRPDWTKDFEARPQAPGEEPTLAWQRALWRRLVGLLGASHWAGLIEKAVESLGKKRPPELPQRIDLFGLGTLPPQFLALLQALSRHVELHLYLLGPTDQYWSDLATSRQSARLSLQGGDMGLDQDCPLLAFLGRMGQDFLKLQEELLPGYLSGLESFPEPEAPLTLVKRLQLDLLQLAAPPFSPLEIGPDDSLEFHRCHSPLREVETAKNRILATLAQRPELQPTDFLVLVSDLDTYGPLVSAVFGQAPKLPFCIADRPLEQESLLIGALLKLLRSATPRYGLVEVLGWLELSLVRRRFGFEPTDLDWARELLFESGVRWGRNPAQKASLGQPAVLANSWEFGFRRLFLGYALEPQGVVQEVWPMEGVEGKDFDRLGALADFWEAYQSLMDRLEGEKTLADWSEVLEWTATHLLESEQEEDWELEEFRILLANLKALPPGDLRLDKRGLALLLEDLMGAAESGRGFLAQGVNLSGMKPMRSLPFPVILGLGLGHGQFPGQNQPTGFDLTRRSPRPGDRSKTEDDKYLFLEAILAARGRLIFCYQGQSPKDNTPQPPSVVLGELLAHLDQRYRLEGQKPSEALVYTQPLWPHDPRCFDPDFPQTASFHPQDWANAQARPGEAEFLGSPLEEPQLDRLELHRLEAFLKDPVAGFFRFGLGLEALRLDQGFAEREPQELDHLESHWFRLEIFNSLEGGKSLEEAWAQLAGEGLMPYGAEGRRRFEALAQEVGRSRKVYLRYRGQQGVGPKTERTLALGNLTLKGLAQGEGRVFWSPSSPHGKMLLGFWVDHLFANATLGPHETCLVARTGEAFRLKPVPEPLAPLGALVGLYRQGLREPLPFFPKEGWHLQKTQKMAWVGLTEAQPKETEAYQRAFGDLDLLADDRCKEAQSRFMAMSAQVFGPLQQSLEVLP